MNYKSTILLLFTILLAFCAFSQQDTTNTGAIITDRGQITGQEKAVESKTEAELEQLHSPKKAWILSAVLPGAGQIYNRKYWKAPIVWGGLAVAGYFLVDNLNQIEIYREAYRFENDDDPNTENNTGYNSSQLLILIDDYKTWRDWSYIALGAIYILNIIDANVDAHLFYFDVSDDITMNVAPYVNPFANQSAGISLTLKL